MHSHEYYKNLEEQTKYEIRAELLNEILHILNTNICDHHSHDGKADFRFINISVMEEIKKLTEKD